MRFSVAFQVLDLQGYRGHKMWWNGATGRILRLMDDPAIKLYPDKNSGAWNWELLLRGKRIAHGESSDTQEAAYTAARQALAEERERRSNR